MAKSLDRATITVYQPAAGKGILTWLQNALNTLITALGNAIYYPFLAPVVILGAIRLAWQGAYPQARHQDHRGHDMDGPRLRLQQRRQAVSSIAAD